MINVLLILNTVGLGNLYTLKGVMPIQIKYMLSSRCDNPSTNSIHQLIFGNGDLFVQLYMQDISDVTSDHRGFIKKETLFQWTEAHDVEFLKIKDQLSEMSVLGT